MSSFVAHALAAHGIRTAADGPARRLNRWAWLPILGFAWLPDGDYAMRLLGFGDPQVRWSHSFAFVASTWTAFAVLVRAVPVLRERFGGTGSLLACSAAGASHLVMDWLVGSAWGDPLFWPICAERLSSPIGILPFGSSDMDPARLRTWRNLAMELGVLSPFVWLALRHRAGRAGPASLAVAVILAAPSAIWAASLWR